MKSDPWADFPVFQVAIGTLGNLNQGMGTTSTASLGTGRLTRNGAVIAYLV